MATAKSGPRTPAVSTNIEGSIRGDEIQNAMTADNGTPMASSATMIGMTTHEQKGYSAPKGAVTRTMRTSRPWKALAIKPSAPLARA